MSNIFLTESPFQVDNALKIHVKGDYLILRMNGNKKNDQQMELLSNKFQGIVHKKKIKSKSKKELFFYIIKFVIPIILFNFRKKLVIGNYDSSWMRTIAYLLKPFNFYVLDDGLITIRVIKKLENRFLDASFLGQCLLKLCYPIFITKYDIQTDNVKIIKLNKSENKNKKTIKKGHVCFIGSPLVEKDVISKCVFFNYLDSILQDVKFKKQSLEYFPHRAEVINEGVKCIITDIISSDLNIESYYNSCEELPEFFISFYSSALINLKENYPDCEFISYMIDPSDINEKYRDVVIDAYDFLEQSDFKVIRND